VVVPVIISGAFGVFPQSLLNEFSLTFEGQYFEYCHLCQVIESFLGAILFLG
jgi:hypothetical protein